MYLSLFVMCVGVFWHNVFGFPFFMKSKPEEHVYYRLPNLMRAYGVVHSRTHKTVQKQQGINKTKPNVMHMCTHAALEYIV